MEFFDKEGEMRYIKEELKKTDEFYNLFKREFSKIVGNLILEIYPTVKSDPVLDGIITNYAVVILNSTEAVIDKDQSYMDYRLEEELNTMTQLVLKLTEIKKSDAFTDAVHQKAKEQMVKYFDDIYDLSANGFRLLERNAKLYNLEFCANFYSLLSTVEPSV